MTQLYEKYFDEVFNTKVEYVFKRTKVKGDQAIQRGKQVCELLIYLHKSLPELKAASVDDIWELEGSPVNTYKAYLYSLQFLSYLNNAIEETSEQYYFEKFEEILLSWLSFERESPEKIVWYDFTVANRVIIITHFLSLANQKSFKFKYVTKERLIDSLIKCGDFLYEETNYRDDNHGIMMDRALLQLSLFINKPPYENWRKRALTRLETQLSSSFTNDFINVENSPEYHNHTYQLFEELSDFYTLNQFESDANLIIEMLKKIKNAHNNMLKPDLTYPLVGDTNKHVYKEDLYIPQSIVYKDTGIGLLKTDISYLFVRSGFTNNSHKHHDELAFVYNFMGVDVFLDAGKYNYNNKDPFRSYIKSPFAHNGIVINKSEYKLNTEEREKAGIKNYSLGEMHGFVHLYNNHYSEANLSRKLIHLYPNIIILIDDIKTDGCPTITQNFNINPEFEVNGLSSNKVMMSHKDLDMSLEIEQRYYDGMDLEYYKGYNDKDQIRGYYSEEFSQVKASHAVMFNGRETKNLVTTITMKTDDDLNCKEFESLKLHENEFTFIMKKNEDRYLCSINHETGELKKHIVVSSIDVQKNLPGIKVSIVAVGHNLEFACYILLNGKIVEKLPYQKTSVFESKVEHENKNLEVWTFVRSHGNKDIKLITKTKISN